MMIVGELGYSGGQYYASLDAIRASSSGKTPDKACDGLAVEIIDKLRDYGLPGFDFQITHDGERTVYLSAKDAAPLVGMVLIEMRNEHKVPLSRAQTRLKATTADYAKFEAGLREPSIETLSRVLEVVAPTLKLAIISADARVLPRVSELEESRPQPVREKRVKLPSKPRAKSRS